MKALTECEVCTVALSEPNRECLAHYRCTTCGNLFHAPNPGIHTCPRHRLVTAGQLVMLRFTNWGDLLKHDVRMNRDKGACPCDPADLMNPARETAWDAEYGTALLVVRAWGKNPDDWIARHPPARRPRAGEIGRWLKEYDLQRSLPPGRLTRKQFWTHFRVLIKQTDPTAPGCWLWDGKVLMSGALPQIRIGSVRRGPIRWAMETFVLKGFLPPDKAIGKPTCGHRTCVNPYHRPLEPNALYIPPKPTPPPPPPVPVTPPTTPQPSYPAVDFTLWSGKYAGLRLSELPDSHLEWMATQGQYGESMTRAIRLERQARARGAKAVRICRECQREFPATPVRVPLALFCDTCLSRPAPAPTHPEVDTIAEYWQDQIRTRLHITLRIIDHKTGHCRIPFVPIFERLMIRCADVGWRPRDYIDGVLDAHLIVEEVPYTDKLGSPEYQRMVEEHTIWHRPPHSL